MSYTRVNWQDSPSTATPRNATNFNKMDEGIKEHDDMLLGNKAIEKIVVGDIEGKNLFDKDGITIKIGYYPDANTGEETAGNSYGYTFTPIKVKPNTTYTISGTIGVSGALGRIYYYQQDGTYISVYGEITNEPLTFTTPANCYLIRFRFSKIIVNFNTIQIEKGASATEYDKFNRYGYNSEESMGNIVVDDIECKNLAKPLRYGYYNSSSGVYAYSTNYQCSAEPIYVKSGSSYCFSIDGVGKNAYVYTYDNNKNFIERLQVPTSGKYTPASNVYYFDYSFGNASVSDVPIDSKIQIELGNKVTPYTPYKSFDNTAFILWTNPSPTSEFAGQSITLNDAIENYKYYEIIYKTNTTNDYHFSTGKIPINLKTRLITSISFNYIRNISSITGTTLNFGVCSRYDTYGNSATTAVNTYLIPYQILGYK